MLNYYLPVLIEWFNKLLSEMEFNKKDELFIVRNNNLILTWVHFNESQMLLSLGHMEAWH